MNLRFATSSRLEQNYVIMLPIFFIFSSFIIIEFINLITKINGVRGGSTWLQIYYVKKRRKNALNKITQKYFKCVVSTIIILHILVARLHTHTHTYTYAAHAYIRPILVFVIKKKQQQQFK